MLTSVVQRWRDNRASYRPAGETISTSRFSVEPIASDKVASSFVRAHHYSASYPAARRRFGLYEGPELVGVAVFSQPTNNASLAPLGCPAEVGVELGRLVLLDQVPANGETWFLARCFDQLRAEGFAGAISFSDPLPRQDASGATVFRGHVGTIYQASNAVYLGRARAEGLRLLADGSVLHNRALAKLRKKDRGWRYVADRLEHFGAAPIGEQDPRAWVDEWLPRLVRVVRHPGNHRYAFAFDKGTRRRLPPSQPYPKFSLLGGHVPGDTGAPPVARAA
jgi:hypothetical protein